MKRFNFLILLMVFLMGCDKATKFVDVDEDINPTTNCKFIMKTYFHPEGYSFQEHLTYCDSFQMETTNIAMIYVDGNSNKMVSKGPIYVETNENYKKINYHQKRK